MTDYWIEQIATALVAVHLLVVAALAAVLVLAADPQTPVRRPSVDGSATAGVHLPEPVALAVAPHPVQVEDGGIGRHRKAA